MSTQAMEQVLERLKHRLEAGKKDSTRDMLAAAQYAQKLRASGTPEPLDVAAAQVLENPRD